MGRIEPDRDAETANGNGDQRLPVSGVLLREATAAEIAAAAAWYAARSRTLAERAKQLKQMARARAESANEQHHQKEIASQRNAGR